MLHLVSSPLSLLSPMLTFSPHRASYIDERHRLVSFGTSSSLVHRSTPFLPQSTMLHRRTAPFGVVRRFFDSFTALFTLPHQSSTFLPQPAHVTSRKFTFNPSTTYTNPFVLPQPSFLPQSTMLR